MRKKEKAALGCVGVLALLGLGVVVLVLTGWGTILKNVVVLGGKATAMTELAKRTPFSPEAGACLTSGQLEAFVTASRLAKPAADRIDAWESANTPADGAGKRVFKGQAAGLVADFIQELAAAMEGEGIGPTEFAWIGGRIERATSGGPQADSCAAAERALVEARAGVVRAAALGAHARRIAFGFARTAPATR